MSRPLLYGTPLSHFTRKIRILCAELGVDVELVLIEGGVIGADPARFADNPLMRVPALVDGATTIFESDHIARYLVARHDDARDRLGVRSEDADDLNRLAVVNGVMANEVVLILAKRGGGLEDLERVTYFRKLLGAIAGGLAWLDERVPAIDAPFDYRDIATVSMWQHLAHYGPVPLGPYPRLAEHVARHSGRASVAPSAPGAVTSR